jgi:hypothetical protein
MSLPDGGTIVSYNIPETYQGGRFFPVLLDIDHESGGVGIQNSSQGLSSHVWTTVITEDKTTIITSSDIVPDTVLYTGNNITEVSLTFDQLMNPAFCFIEDGEMKLRWYNSLESGMVTTNFGSGYVSPKVSLDDKEDNTGISDVIFAYIKDNILYYRQQRDRYEIEYQVSDSPVRRIQKIGMTSGFRFQFLCLV